MGSDQKRALDSDGVGETFRPPADKILIAEEDAAHPNHREHMLRVRENNPGMLALLTSLRTFGWHPTEIISVYKDGARYVVSNGRRRLTAVRIINQERKPKDHLRPRIVIDKDPLLTETIANAMHEDDPPMVKARRYVQLQETLGNVKAAAALGLTLKDAQALAEILRIPNVELHAAVNAREVPIDVANRAAKNGSATVRKVLEKAKGNGKATAATVRAAAREIPKRAKTQPSKRIASLADTYEGHGEAADRIAVLLRWAAGLVPDPPKWLAERLEKIKAEEKGAEA